MSDAPNTIPSSSLQAPVTKPSTLHSLGFGGLSVMLYLALLDCSVETFLSQSPLRWIIAGIVVGFAALSVLLWRRTTWATKASVSFFVLFGLMALAAWRPEGSDSPITLLRQPTSTLLSGATIFGILLAGWILAQFKFLPWPARVALLLVAAYGVAAFVLGIIGGTPYAALLHGESLWERLPFWLQGGFVGAAVVLPGVFLLQLVAAASRIRAGQLRDWSRQTLALGLCLTIGALGSIGSGTVVALSESEIKPSPQYASWRQMGKNGPGLQGAATENLLSPAPRTLELSHVDSDYFAAALGKDPSKIFAFVRDRIAYEAYVGCLRGPKGTLMAMAGNSVDRAALLADLLAKSGGRVRYVQGTLSEALAQELIASMWRERSGTALAQGRLADEPSGEPKIADSLLKNFQRDFTSLRNYMNKAGEPASPDSETNPGLLVKEAQDHYWVQWWNDGKWVDLDPSFGDATPGRVYGQMKETFDALPPGMFHRIEIHIRLEEYTDNKPSTREILQYAVNAADLSGADVFLLHRAGGDGDSDDLSPSAIAGQLEAAPDTTLLKPVLLIPGKPGVIGLSFRSKQPPNAATTDLGGELGGGEESAPVPIATAESVELDFIAPGHPKGVSVREIFDLLGRARRAENKPLDGDELRALTSADNLPDLVHGVYDFFFTTGSIDITHLANLSGEDASSPPESERVDVGAVLRRLNISFSAISDALSNRLSTPDGSVCRFYFDSPRVQIAELSTRGDLTRLSLDLRRDKARAVGNGVGAKGLFYAQMVRGVFDGTWERVLMDYVGAPLRASGQGMLSISTSWIFEEGQAQAVPLILLFPKSSALPADLTPGTAALIRQSLAQGYLVLAPQRSIALADARRSAWWQVDPHSGETIAVTDDALHQSNIEYKVIINKEQGTGIMWWQSNGRVFGHMVGKAPEIYQKIAEIQGAAARVYSSLSVSWM